MIEYTTNLECGASKCLTVLEGSRPSLPTVPPTLPMGWVLKSIQSRRTKLTENQKQYLNAKFQIGERTGKKADLTEVSKAMIQQKIATGKDYLTMRIFSPASKLAVTSLALLLSEVSK